MFDYNAPATVVCEHYLSGEVQVNTVPAEQAVAEFRMWYDGLTEYTVELHQNGVKFNFDFITDELIVAYVPSAEELADEAYGEEERYCDVCGYNWSNEDPCPFH